MAIASNKVLQKAEAEYTYLTGDAAQRRLEELRVKWEIDRVYGLSSAKAEGIKLDKAEGIKQNKIEIAKEMLKQGLSMEIIIAVTKLTREEIEKLK